MQNKILLILFLLIYGCNSETTAQFRPAKIFGEHMVLQRDVVVKIWGWSSANDIVLFEFNRKLEKGQADENGYWEFVLPAQKAGGPHQIKVYNAKKKVEWEDVYFGDVWLCSGQSNMEWPLKFTENAEAEIAVANDPEIREFKVPLTASETLAKDLEGGEWKKCGTETVGDFTAVGYYFAKHIKTSQGIPIGLINSSWGGSRIEPWMSAEFQGLHNLDEFFENLAAKRKKEKAIILDRLIRDFKGFKQPKERLIEKTVDWEQADFNDEHWIPLKININWENEGYEKLDGVMWYRRSFDLKRSEAKKSYLLQLGMIDDSDRTFVNGILIGKMDGAHNISRSYEVPPKLLKPGKNVIAVRVEDTGGGGGINGIKGELGLKSESSFIDLHAGWKVALEAQYVDSDYAQNQVPTILYHQMIYPLANFPIKGVIWYQGESNTGETAAYADLFKALINNWRDLWGNPQLPFLFVQLAAFQDPPIEPEYSSWPELREAQKTALELKHTGMAVTIDIGDKDDIHPRNKLDVGRRLGLIAENIVYGKKEITFQGPEPEKISLKGNEIIIEYKHDQGLYFKNDNLSERQFSVAGANGKYYWAKPKLVEGKVILSCPEVTHPFEVRYAWAINPDQASLYNGAGLPATPFTMKVSR